MVKFEFYAQDEDLDRLFLEKEKRGGDCAGMTGNEFAHVLLHEYLRKLQPHLPAPQDEEY